MRDLHTRKSVDRIAAKVTSTGEHYEPNVPKANAYDSDLPIVTTQRHPEADNLEGRRVGRLNCDGLSWYNTKGRR